MQKYKVKFSSHNRIFLYSSLLKNHFYSNFYLSSYKLSCFVQTEGDVDTSDIQMHTVRVVTAEPMKTLTGSSLINWVSYKYDAPFLYASAQKANRMSVLVTKETGR